MGSIGHQKDGFSTKYRGEDSEPTGGDSMIEMKVTEPARVVGIAWYRVQDYSQIREIMTDAANFPPTFRHVRATRPRNGTRQYS